MWGRNYGHAGSLEYWSRRYKFPPVISSHNKYLLWDPPSGAGEVVIAIGGSREELEELFEEVIYAGVAETPYAIENRMTVWVCRYLRRPIGEIWNDFKSFG